MTDSPTFNVEAALAATTAPRVTPDRIQAVIAGQTFARLTGTLTVCVLTLVNGFTVTGESACASPENYDQDIGEHYARKDAERKIWPLEGYLLRQQLHDATMPELENLAPAEQPAPDGPMCTYVGTKIINARPMNRQDYNDLRGWLLPADEDGTDQGYLVEYTDGGKPNLAGFAGYVSWSPREQFEKAYRSIDHGLGIGEAVAAMVAGRRVARAGWNGKRMFAYFVPPAAYPVQTGAAKAHFGEGALVPYRGYLALKTVDEDVATWAPSASDTLATDWCVLPD